MYSKGPGRQHGQSCGSMILRFGKLKHKHLEISMKLAIGAWDEH